MKNYGHSWFLTGRISCYGYKMSLWVFHCFKRNCNKNVILHSAALCRRTNYLLSNRASERWSWRTPGTFGAAGTIPEPMICNRYIQNTITDTVTSCQPDNDLNHARIPLRPTGLSCATNHFRYGFKTERQYELFLLTVTFFMKSESSS